jgi:hypothetical protein
MEERHLRVEALCQLPNERSGLHALRGEVERKQDVVDGQHDDPYAGMRNRADGARCNQRTNARHVARSTSTAIPKPERAARSDRLWRLSR